MTDGTTSSLYGNYAMGGVINIITSRPTRQMLELKPQYGNRNSPKLDFFASDRWRNLGAAIEGSFFKTDGFPIVAPIERGPIDNNANVQYRNVSAKLEYAPSDRVSAFFRAGYFSEDRNNAKIGELNDTRWTTVNGGVRMRMPSSGECNSIQAPSSPSSFGPATCTLRYTVAQRQTHECGASTPVVSPSAAVGSRTCRERDRRDA